MEEIKGIDKKLQENLKPLTEGLKALRSRLGETITREKDFYAFKSEFQTHHPDLYRQCGLDGATSFEDAQRLMNRYEIILLEKIDALEEEAAEAKALLIAEMKARAEKKDAIRKETLKFFAEIGFDMFSQAETDAVFEWLNSNQAIWASLGMNTQFDIENGVLGYEGTFSHGSEVSLQEKKVFAKVFNKMLTGSVEFPVCFDGMGNCVFYPSISAAEEQRFDPMFDMKFFGEQRL